MTRRLFLFLLPLLYLLGLLKRPTPAPTPRSILGDKLVHNYDATSIAGKQRVSCWRDESGNGWDMVAVDPNHAPTWRGGE